MGFDRGVRRKMFCRHLYNAAGKDTHYQRTAVQKKGEGAL